MNWLFLRGLLREKRHWGDFTQIFESKVSGSKVFLLDHPGIGEEESRALPGSMGEWVLDLRRRWKSLDVDLEKPCYILGHSLGGMVALKWVDLYPGDFKGIVSINTSAANVASPWRRLKFHNIPKLIKMRGIKDPFEREELILSLITGIRERDANLVRSWAEISKDPKAQRNLTIHQLKMAMTFVAPSKIEIPGLFLAAKLDQFTDYRCSKKLAQNLNSRYQEHAFAGHDLCLDAPSWVCHKIRRFVKEVVIQEEL